MAQLNDLIVTGKASFLNEIKGKIDWTNINNKPSSFTPASHTHGNIQNGGTLQTTDVTIANGDKLVVTDSSDSSKIARTSISFDGSTTTQCLTKKGTWATFGTSNLAIGTTASTAMAGNTNVNNVTQTASLTADTEYGLLLTNSALDSSNHTEGARKSLYLKYSEVPGKDNSTYGTLKVLSGGTSYHWGVKISQCDIELITEGYEYEWTWGGISSSLNTSIETAKTTVKQSPSTTNANYELLFSNSADNTDRTETTKKSSTLLFNPAQKALTGGTRKANTTVGEYSFSVGISNTASGYCCQAFGNEVSATNNNTFAHGYQTVASHYCAHAEGWQTTASGQSSHAEGEGTIANHRNQHVFGKFNIADPSTAVADADGTFIEIVGNGGGSSSKSNARTLDWGGNEWLAGGLTFGKGGQINFLPADSGQGTGDILWVYYESDPSKAPQEKCRIWCDGSFTAAGGPYYRCYKSDNTLLYNGRLQTVSSSDIRLKENITDTEITNALDTINQIKLHAFDWKTTGEHQAIGMIADEVEELDSHFLNPGGGGVDSFGEINPKTIDTYYVMNYMIKAIQELSAEVDELKAQLNK